MQNGADDLGTPGKDIYFGYGRINAGNSLVPLTHVDGTLVKTASEPAVYLLENGKKRHITSPEVFNTWFDWRDIIIVSSSEMNSYATGDVLGFKPGTLVKTSDGPEVYVVVNNTIRHIVSPEVFMGLDYNWSNIVLVTSSDLEKYSQGDKLVTGGTHPEGAVIKSTNAPEVYLLDGGKKRHLPNPEVFYSRYNWEEVLWVSPSEMASYSAGERIGFRPGSLVKANDQSEVYVITDTTKRHISSPQIFVAKGYRWDNVVITTAAELDNYTTGEDL